MPVLPDGTIVDQQGNPTGQRVDLQTNEVTGTINTSLLTPPPSTSGFQTPQQTPTFPVAGLGADLFAPTEPEKKATDVSTRLQELNQRLLGESTFRTEQEAQQGVPEATKTFRDLSAQLKTIQNEALAIPLQLQQEATGRGITTSGLEPIQAGRLRANAIQALGVSSLLEASRGNLITAFDLVDRSVAQRFDPIKEEIKVKTANLDLILKSPDYSLAEKRRAQTQKEAQETRTKEVERQEETAKQIQNIAVKVAATGRANAVQLDAIRKAKDEIEAARLAAPFLQPAPQIDTGQTEFERAFFREHGRLPTVTEFQERRAPGQSEFERAFFREHGRLPTATELRAKKQEEPILTIPDDTIASRLTSVGLSPAILTTGNKLTKGNADTIAAKGVPPSIVGLITQAILEGDSLNDIRTALAEGHGQDVGFGYLDTYMSALQKTSEEEIVNPFR